jgi:hypothetical protein
VHEQAPFIHTPPLLQVIFAQASFLQEFKYSNELKLKKSKATMVIDLIFCIQFSD